MKRTKKGGFSLKELIDSLVIRTRDLTNIGKSNDFSFITDKNAHDYNAERYAFYVQFIDAIQDKNLVENVLKIYNFNEQQREDVRKNINEYINDLKKWRTILIEKQGYTEEKADEEIRNTLKTLLLANPITDKLTVGEPKDVLIGDYLTKVEKNPLTVWSFANIDEQFKEFQAFKKSVSGKETYADEYERRVNLIQANLILQITKWKEVLDGMVKNNTVNESTETTDLPENISELLGKYKDITELKKTIDEANGIIKDVKVAPSGAKPEGAKPEGAAEKIINLQKLRDSIVDKLKVLTDKKNVESFINYINLTIEYLRAKTEKIQTDLKYTNVADDGWCFFYAANAALAAQVAATTVTPAAPVAETPDAAINELKGAINSEQTPSERVINVAKIVAKYSKSDLTIKNAVDEEAAQVLINEIINVQSKSELGLNKYTGTQKTKIWATEQEISAATKVLNKCIWVYLTYTLNGNIVSALQPMKFGQQYDIDCNNDPLKLVLSTGIQKTTVVNDPDELYKEYDKIKNKTNSPGIHFGYISSQNAINNISFPDIDKEYQPQFESFAKQTIPTFDTEKTNITETLKTLITEWHNKLEAIITQISSQHRGGAISFFTDIRQRLEDANKKDPQQAFKERQQIVELVKSDDRFSFDNKEVTATDRLIFIAISYVIRALSLFIVEWAVMTQFTNSFREAFFLYFGLYLIFFGILVGIVNFSDSIFMKMLFYYIDGKDQAKGWYRIIVHIVIQLLLLPIPFIISDQPENYLTDLSFSQRRTIVKSIENFSLFVWLFLSFIVVVF